jgi:hypothetical protein
MGTFLGGPDDPNSDFQKLINHGWTLQGLPKRFLLLAAACWAWIGFYYLINLVRKDHAARR